MFDEYSDWYSTLSECYAHEENLKEQGYRRTTKPLHEKLGQGEYRIIAEPRSSLDFGGPEKYRIEWKRHGA